MPSTDTLDSDTAIDVTVMPGSASFVGGAVGLLSVGVGVLEGYVVSVGLGSVVVGVGVGVGCVVVVDGAGASDVVGVGVRVPVTGGGLRVSGDDGSREPVDGCWVGVPDVGESDSDDAGVDVRVGRGPAVSSGAAVVERDGIRGIGEVSGDVVRGAYVEAAAAEGPAPPATRAPNTAATGARKRKFVAMADTLLVVRPALAHHCEKA